MKKLVKSEKNQIRTKTERKPTQKFRPVDAFQEISPTGDGRIMPVVRETLKGCCAGCAVPSGIFKAMQVAAGLALPKDISITFKNVQADRL